MYAKLLTILLISTFAFLTSAIPVEAINNDFGYGCCCNGNSNIVASSVR
jgi:hypothetical protein